MTNRNDIINQILPFKDKQIIKVLTGFRRSGKSTIFDLYIDYLLKNNIEQNNIIYINFENPTTPIENYKDLYNYIISKIKNKNKYYIFLDEIQTITNFQKAIDGLYLNKNLDIYITGSNAYILSGELATLLSGRYIEIKILPYSFKEFIIAYNNNLPQNIDTKKYTFEKYLINGGMPGNVDYINTNATYQYLDSILSTVIYKDIMLKNNINDKILMDSIIKYMMSCIGSTITIKGISDYLNSNHYKTTNHTVENYISAFLNSFLFYKIDTYNIEGKTILKRNYKYYIVDTGFINLILGNSAFKNYGHILENIVFLELKRRYNEVFIGKYNNYEIDFVCIKQNEKTYIQVSLDTKNETTLNRELAPLKSIKENYPKILLTLDDIPTTDFDGIKRINIINWLLNKT